MVHLLPSLLTLHFVTLCCFLQLLAEETNSPISPFTSYDKKYIKFLSAFATGKSLNSFQNVYTYYLFISLMLRGVRARTSQKWRKDLKIRVLYSLPIALEQIITCLAGNNTHALSQFVQVRSLGSAQRTFSSGSHKGAVNVSARLSLPGAQGSPLSSCACWQSPTPCSL